LIIFFVLRFMGTWQRVVWASPPALINYRRDALARLRPKQVSLCASWKFQTQHGERAALQQVFVQTLQAATLKIRA
jgi:hypothetical protein